MSLRLVARALRLPFLTVSVLPYVFGAGMAEAFDSGLFALGLIAVASTHLAANLANDYGDARSGADAKDPSYYGYFGGSKLIQEGRLSLEFYRNGAVGFGLIAMIAGAAAVLLRGLPELVLVLAVVLLLSLAYTLPPLRLGYRRLGEFTVFLLFGPACVLGGALLQGEGIGTPALWILSFPFGLFASSVLVVNEVPDARTDAASGKQTLVVALGAQWGFLLFLLLALGGIGTVAAAVWLAYLPYHALLVCVVVPLILRAALILRNQYEQKASLPRASRLAVGIHSLSSLILIAAVWS